MLLALYGLKIYLFYIPLLFLMPFLFRTEQEINRQMTWYALIAIPICLLGAAQFAAGSASPLNVLCAKLGREHQRLWLWRKSADHRHLFLHHGAHDLHCVLHRAVLCPAGAKPDAEEMALNGQGFYPCWRAMP